VSEQRETTHVEGPPPETPNRPEAGERPEPRRRGRMTAVAHDVPPAIQWHEGMLLAPQHFQQLALRQEALLRYQIAMTSPYHWGVRHLKIDPVLLVDGVFRVLELEAVLPDGLVVSHFPDDSPDLAVDLGPYDTRLLDGPLPVHLAVVAERGSLARVGNEGSRFESVEGDPVVDENTGEGELRVPRLKPLLRLLVTDSPPPKFVTLPLAEVTHSRESFSLTPFIPPTLRVTPVSPLADFCTALSGRLREKAVFLSEQGEPSSAVRAAQLIETQSLVHGLVAALPPFEALVYSGVAHPFQLYLALCGLVGHLAAVSRSLMPPVLDPYDHNDLRATFEQARAFIEQALREGISESYAAHPFYLAEGSFFLKFDPQWMNRPLVLGVRGKPGAAERDLAAWIQAAVIASKSRMPELQQKRVLGVRRKKIEADTDLVPARGVLLYSISAEPELVVSEELLEVRNPDDPDGQNRPTEVVLYVRR